MLAIDLRDTATAHAAAHRDFKGIWRPSRRDGDGAVIAPLDGKAMVYLDDIPKYSTL
jgi:hypothetical protein